jgi:uncharacterized protein YkwD
MTVRPGVPAPRRGFAAGLLALLFGASLVLAAVMPVAAATPSTVGAQIVGWVNQARVARGLRELRTDARLSAMAADRARILADANLLDHSYPGDIGAQLDGRGIQWYRYGEVLAWSSATFGGESAWAIYRAWQGSPSHWSLLMSSQFNYFGPGIAQRAANGATYASVLLTESLDHTAPVARIHDTARSGTTVTWWWRGWDPPLQTHTAGIWDYDVQYRVDSGAWSTIRNDSTSTGLRLYSRPHGHTYGLRVRTRDRRGTVSPWSTEIRIAVP